ncbi:hypothetical protein HNP25_002629 [Arcicella rosea]|uniref:Uncharacterized protein n=1 Tax=Arcicella rosea TaxID=502909 RepID=A0A841ETI0_9BACT|nr:hypothetical protein [Arcicella rosea]
MRVKAFVLSPILTGLVSFIIYFVFNIFNDGFHFDKELTAAIYFFVLIPLFVQLLFVEPCLFLISYFKRVDLKTYYYFAICCCYFLTSLMVDITSSKVSIFKSIKDFVSIFSLFFFYSLVNSCFYNLFYFKHKHEDLQRE